MDTPDEPSKKSKLTLRIIIGMILGISTGFIINQLGNPEWINTWLTEGLFHVTGTLFIRSLQLLVVPLVFVSLVCGSAAMEDIRRLGRVGGKTVGLYLVTTTIAISLGMAFGLIVKPGEGLTLNADQTFEAPTAPPLTEVFINIVPTNPLQAMAEGNMLQIIVFSILFGLALTMAGQAGKTVLSGFEALNEVIMKLVLILIQLAPFGVFALLAKTFAEEGFDAILPLAKYFFLVVGVLLLHAFLTYPLFLRAFGKISPFPFFRKMRKAQIFAFSTASSNATIPVTLEVVEEELGVDNSISSFTVPLGATINMDGTAIMQGVATIFIAQASGIDLALTELLTVILMATLASIGTAGVPGVGLIMLTIVLVRVGLPIEPVGIILGIDRMLDMLRTAVNITGDATVTCIVGKSENRMDTSVFES
jgi:Na+/H+-dicarboxylate symporter